MIKNNYITKKGENLLIRLFEMCINDEFLKITGQKLVNDFKKNAILVANTAQGSEIHENSKKDALAVVYDMVEALVGHPDLVDTSKLLEYRVGSSLKFPNMFRYLYAFQKNYPKHIYKFPKPLSKETPIVRKINRKIRPGFEVYQAVPMFDKYGRSMVKRYFRTIVIKKYRNLLDDMLLDDVYNKINEFSRGYTNKFHKNLKNLQKAVIKVAKELKKCKKKDFDLNQVQHYLPNTFCHALQSVHGIERALESVTPLRNPFLRNDYN